MKLFGSIIVLLIGLVSSIECYKVLIVSPFVAKSHSIIGEAYMRGLIDAGHEVTMITAYKMKVSSKNYKEIYLEGVDKVNKMSNLFDMQKLSLPDIITGIYNMGIGFTNFTLNHPLVKDLIEQKPKFDIVLTEIFVNEALLGFGDIFQASVIGYSTFGASKWTNDLVGTPSPLSYVPHTFLSFRDKMSFTERFGNTLVTIFENTYINFVYLPRQQALYDIHFPNAKSSFHDARKNVNMVLLNSHVTLSYPRPYPPNMIEVGGLHIKRVAKPLPENIKSFIEGSPDGVVYFSLGSNVKSSQLPIEKRDALLRVFGKLKERVLWKWEEENLPGKPDNVMISKWFPQDDILAHPNVRVFITHGGLLSTMEATFHGVPLIGIPIFGDQTLNMAKTEKAGYGVTVEYIHLTETTISRALNEVLNNKKYRENAKTISARFRDQQNDPLKSAIHWIEYVAKHNGAPHLRSAGQDLSFIQYHNLDVLALIAIIVSFTIYFILIVFGFITNIFKPKPKPQKTKRN